ncbi:flagellar hook-associated protein FlgL [Enterobacter sp. CC120223-11]|uniref:flagellar hook-associated protein FlgL n=1 Tax=Enterobacter sp. CC120223-11 TaxID=1378073 RepID=UPI000BC9EDF5|nr:flagellar hook-associated protein FlgL [Enterobacter sp. CC120223-11]SNY67703.1 flagellar hook-associated protein 3 FlgL [Enterobacter sp. CC120223-11]
MRISTLYMFKKSAENMSKRVSENNDIMTRLASGKTLLRASDDPNAATDAVKYTEALAKLEMYSNTRSAARNTLQHEDHILSSVSSLMTGGLTEKIIAAKSETYSKDDLAALGKELQGIRANMLDLANSRDGNGRYIFSGFKTDKPAFDENGIYQGDNNARTVTVADGTVMKVSHPGNEVFADDLFTKLEAAITELSRDTIDRDDLNAALSAASEAVTVGIGRLGKAQTELGTNLQQLDAFDLTADNLIIDMKVKIQTATGSDYSAMTSMIMDTKMSEFSLNASMLVFQSMQKMNLFNK